MPGVVLPPYASPTGPELSREKLIGAFLDGARTGFSADLHIEDQMLLAERMIPLGVRVGRRSLLLRADVAPPMADLKRAVEEYLQAKGLRLLDADTRLGDIAAIQTIGVRGAAWDLWGEDRAEADRDLEKAALGEDAAMVDTSSSGPGDAGIGMTLEELLGDDRHSGERDDRET